jgi:glycerol uptake facilitator-like aquaporin
LKRSWNPLLWVGFAIAFLAFPAYFVYFIRFQSTREIPWPNFLLSAVAVFMLALGLWRAFKQPQAYRGKIAGPILATLSVFLIGYFFVGIYSGARNLPASMNAPQIGQRVPNFTLPDSEGQRVTLYSLLDQPFGSNDWPPKADAAKKAAGTILIFYRGYW